MNIIRFIKEWTLPVAIGTGIVVYLVFALVGHLSRLPPNFCVTTAAADAHGQMMHVSMASASTRLSPLRRKPIIAAITAATVNTWNNPTHQCHATGRSLW